MIKIFLHGPLGEKFGREHAYWIDSPREAIRALDANKPGFREAFLAHERYAIHVDGDWRDASEMSPELACTAPVSREVHFAPVIDGQAFLLLPGLAAIGITGVTATIVSGLIIGGLALGASFLLSKKVKPEEQDMTTDKAEVAKRESYAFTGPENVVGQGMPVPLIYGRVHVGSIVVSASLDTVDIAA